MSKLFKMRVSREPKFTVPSTFPTGPSRVWHPHPNIMPPVSPSNFIMPVNSYQVNSGVKVSNWIDDHDKAWFPAIHEYSDLLSTNPEYLSRNPAAFNWFLWVFKYMVFPQIKHVDDLYAKHTTQHNLLSGLRGYFTGISSLDSKSCIFQAISYPSPAPTSAHATVFTDSEFVTWMEGAMKHNITFYLLAKITDVMFGLKK